MFRVRVESGSEWKGRLGSVPLRVNAWVQAFGKRPARRRTGVWAEGSGGLSPMWVLSPGRGPAVILFFTPFLSFSSSSMAMATSSATPSLVGGSHLKTCSLRSNKLKMLAHHQTQLAVGQNKRVNHRRNFSICAEYSNNSRGGGGDFLAGFLLGGVVFGTLAYVFAPQIRRSILNEDEYGFQKAKRPIYYDDGLEKTRQTLTDKIGQLNSAIDNVSSRLRGLRGGSNKATEPAEAESEVEATM